MTPEEQRIAIAEFYGWKRVKTDANWPYRALLEKNGARQIVPDYLNDLNVMHEAALKIGLGLRTLYPIELRRIVTRDATIEMCDPDDPRLVSDLFFYEATAAQRAEAFLRTIGKWHDQPKGTP